MRKKRNFSGSWSSLPGWLLSLLLFMLFYLIMRFRPKNDIKTRLLSVLVPKFGEPLAHFIFAQAAHETGNFTSPLFLANNNCFGMKQPEIRQTTSKGKKNGYASYESIEQSAEDYALYWTARQLQRSIQTVNQFVIKLADKNYFEAPIVEYERGVNYWYNFYFA